MNSQAVAFISGRCRLVHRRASVLKKAALKMLGALVVISAMQVQPAHAADRAAAAPAAGLFGSVALPFGPIRSSQWQRVVASDAGLLSAGCAELDGMCDTELGKDIAQSHAGRLKMSKLDMLRDVNASVNRIVRYRPDREAYGRVDHWASLREITQTSTGDCEDYAFAKMWILQSLGVPMSEMRLVILLDERHRRYHAVLSIRSGQEWLVLDNASDRIHRDTDIDHYLPVYSVSGNQSWVHGFRPGRTDVAFQNVESVHPGEAPR